MNFPFSLSAHSVLRLFAKVRRRKIGLTLQRSIAGIIPEPLRNPMNNLLFNDRWPGLANEHVYLYYRYQAWKAQTLGKLLSETFFIQWALDERTKQNEYLRSETRPPFRVHGSNVNAYNELARGANGTGEGDFNPR